MTQDALAETLGVSKRMVIYLEKGEREPNLETLDKLCTLFKCTSDYLLGKSDIVSRTKLELIIERIEKDLNVKIKDDEEIIQALKNYLKLKQKQEDPS